MADTKLSALGLVSVPALTHKVYGVDGTPTSSAFQLDRTFGLLPSICQGRLTLVSGTAVPASDQSNKTTVFWTPYKGQNAALYDGTRWKMYSVAEVSRALGTLTASKAYDCFLWDNAGTVTLDFSTAWTSATARNDALTAQDGVQVNNASITAPSGNTIAAKAGRYVGTFFTSSTTQTQDKGGGVTTQLGAQRFLWNYYNRVPRHVAVFDSTATWTYVNPNGTWRQANATAGNKVEVVRGFDEDLVDLYGACGITINSSASDVAMGVGIDSTTVNSAQIATGAGAVALNGGASCRYIGLPGQGYHALNWLETAGSAANTFTFYGTDGTTFIQIGLAGFVMA